VLDGFFAQADVPSEIRARKSEAYGRATLVIARNAFRSGHWRRGVELYREACTLHPPLRSVRVKATLLRNIVSKPIRTLLARLKGR
jgi:hypothetical protein